MSNSVTTKGTVPAERPLYKNHPYDLIRSDAIFGHALACITDTWHFATNSSQSQKETAMQNLKQMQTVHVYTDFDTIERLYNLIYTKLLRYCASGYL